MFDGLLHTTDRELLILRKTYPSPLLNPFIGDSCLDGFMLDPAGIVCDDTGARCLQCCLDCHAVLYIRKKLPKFSIANDLYVGKVPPELQELTVVEECMIARWRAKVFVIAMLSPPESPCP